MLVRGLIDTVLSLPAVEDSEMVVIGDVVVGSMHSVLLASNTHCDICVPFEVQLMNTVGKNQLHD